MPCSGNELGVFRKFRRQCYCYEEKEQEEKKMKKE